MVTPLRWGKLRGAPDSWWAADSGLYGARGSRHFSLEAYLGWLKQLPCQDRCLFATAPDVVGDAAATLARSAPVLPAIRGLRYRAALVAQDGLEHLTVPWLAFDCLFVGGTTDWKLSSAAFALTAEAKRRGKWTHMGRVNSLRRLQAAQVGGFDSADGTQLAFRPDAYLPRVLHWLDTLQRQPALPLTPAEAA